MALEPFGPIHGLGLAPMPIGTLFTSREGRSRFIATHFASLWQGRVLDVGCFRRELGVALPPACSYVGIDLMGQPDLVVNLDRGWIPFADDSFEVVVCVDVLEHLERIHQVFDELLRVSRHRVLLTLPNSWHGNWRWVLPGARPESGKYHGLPVQPPLDRHRWFFNTFEAVEFLRGRAGLVGARVDYLDFTLSSSTIRRWFLRRFWGRNYWVWAPATLWVVLSKSPDPSSGA